MDDDTDLLFDLPSVARKNVSAAFEAGVLPPTAAWRCRLSQTGGSASSIVSPD
jgi:hypothetical protein